MCQGRKLTVVGSVSEEALDNKESCPGLRACSMFLQKKSTNLEAYIEQQDNWGLVVLYKNRTNGMEAVG